MLGKVGHSPGKGTEGKFLPSPPCHVDGPRPHPSASSEVKVAPNRPGLLPPPQGVKQPGPSQCAGLPSVLWGLAEVRPRVPFPPARPALQGHRFPLSLQPWPRARWKESLT